MRIIKFFPLICLFACSKSEQSKQPQPSDNPLTVQSTVDYQILEVTGKLQRNFVGGFLLPSTDLIHSDKDRSQLHAGDYFSEPVNISLEDFQSKNHYLTMVFKDSIPQDVMIQLSFKGSNSRRVEVGKVNGQIFVNGQVVTSIPSYKFGSGDKVPSGCFSSNGVNLLIPVN